MRIHQWKLQGPVPTSGSQRTSTKREWQKAGLVSSGSTSSCFSRHSSLDWMRVWCGKDSNIRWGVNEIDHKDTLHFWDAAIGWVPALLGYVNGSMVYLSPEVKAALRLAIQTTNQSIRTNVGMHLELYFWSYWLIYSLVQQIFVVCLGQAKHTLGRLSAGQADIAQAVWHSLPS